MAAIVIPTAGLSMTGVKTAAYTAVAGDHVLVDCSAAGAPFAITLPATPSTGDRLAITLHKASTTAGVYVTLASAKKINGKTALGCYNLVDDGETLEFVYVGSTAEWTIVGNGLRLAQGCVRNSAGQSLTANIMTKLVFNTLDGGPAWFADITNDRFNVRRDGLYSVCAAAYNFAGTVSYGELYKNGASAGIQPVQFASEQRNLYAWTCDCAAGDYLETYYQLNATNSTYASSPYFTRFNAFEVGKN